MSPSALAVIFAILALAFALVAFLFRPKMIMPPSIPDYFLELKSSVHFLYTALPTLLLILTAIGFGSYDVVVNSVTEKVTTEVNKVMQKGKIDSLVNEIKELNKQARIATESILSMEKKDRNKILNIADTSFLRMLPWGTIIPYSGKKENIDTLIWAICDGNEHGKNRVRTPDLRQKFVMGRAWRIEGRDSLNT